MIASDRTRRWSLWGSVGTLHARLRHFLPPPPPVGPPLRRAPIRLLAVFLLVLGLSMPTSVTEGKATAQSLEDLDRIVEQREATESDFTRAVDAFDQLLDDIDAAEGELNDIKERATSLEDQAARLSAALATRARLQFMQGGQPVFTVMAADGPSAAVERAGLLAALNRREAGQLEAATNIRIQLEQTKTLLADRQARLDALAEGLQARRDELESQLGQLQAVEADLRERKSRQIELRNGVINGTYACIFTPSNTHFRDTWGAPRGGGTRSHKGTDVFARHGEPVFAITGGRISRLNSSSIGGISVYLKGDDGHLYYYTHLQGYVSGLSTGKRVEAGEHIAYNGATGNARGGAPHVHFQWHPGGGGPVNPYSTLATICYS